MTGIGVDDGDFIIVRQQNSCRNGDYAVVLVEGRETLLKTTLIYPKKLSFGCPSVLASTAFGQPVSVQLSKSDKLGNPQPP